MPLKNIFQFKKKGTTNDENDRERKGSKYLCFQWSLKKSKQVSKSPQQNVSSTSEELLSQCIENAMTMQSNIRHKRSISLIQTSDTPQVEGRKRKASLPAHLSQLETIPELSDFQLKPSTTKKTK